MALVNAKLIRLTTKDGSGLFQNVETVEVPAQEVLRSEVLVSQATIDETAANYELTGILYIPIIEE